MYDLFGNRGSFDSSLSDTIRDQPNVSVNDQSIVEKFIPFELWLATVISLSLALCLQVVSLRFYVPNYSLNEKSVEKSIYIGNGAISMHKYLAIQVHNSNLTN